jgi:hypothetical protein
MKPTTIAIGLAFLLAAALGLLVLQHQAWTCLRLENGTLQQQLRDLSAQVDQLTAEKERLAKLMESPEVAPGTPPDTEQRSELLRLRGQLGRLRVETREADQAHLTAMRTAQAKIPDAELKVAQLTKLRVDKVVSEQELRQAQFAVELLKAEAKGDQAQVKQLQLRQAEEELARAADLRNQSAISQAEYDEAASKVESLRGGTN